MILRNNFSMPKLFVMPISIVLLTMINRATIFPKYDEIPKMPSKSREGSLKNAGEVRFKNSVMILGILSNMKGSKMPWCKEFSCNLPVFRVV